MNNENAKVHISLRDGVLELEGSEDFVSKQLTTLQPLIQKAFENAPPPAPASHAKHGQENSGSGTTLSDYENLFAEADGKVQILKTLPGSGKAGKTANAALLLAFANSLMGNETTPTKDVRDVCSAHACLDKSNFAQTLKNQNQHLIVTGSGSALSIKLTVPGKKKAQELAAELNQ